MPVDEAAAGRPREGRPEREEALRRPVDAHRHPPVDAGAVGERRAVPRESRRQAARCRRHRRIRGCRA